MTVTACLFSPSPVRAWTDTDFAMTALGLPLQVMTGAAWPSLSKLFRVLPSLYAD